MKVAVLMLVLVAVSAASAEDFREKRFIGFLKRFAHRVAELGRSVGNWIKEKWGSFVEFLKEHWRKVVSYAKGIIASFKEKFHSGHLLSFTLEKAQSVLGRVKSIVEKFGINADFLGTLAGHDGKLKELFHNATSSGDVVEVAKSLFQIGKDLYLNGKAALKDAASHVRENYNVILKNVIAELTKNPTEECSSAVTNVIGDLGDGDANVLSKGVRRALCNAAEFIKEEATEDTVDEIITEHTKEEGNSPSVDAE